VTKRALITGIGGQDGSLLAEQLLDDGYEVAGVTRRDPSEYESLDAVRDRISFFSIDLCDPCALERVVRELEPTETYNFASSSFVPASWEHPVESVRLATVGTTALLEAIRAAGRDVRFCQASSSEIFGDPAEVPQTEDTPVRPVTPYGAAKAFAHSLTAAYRSRHGLHASSAILYNHESPRRPGTFLPRKVSLAVARIKAGLEDELHLGDLHARRDWGLADDYVRAMRSMAAAAEPADYVIATGESHSVGELVTLAFDHVGLDAREYVRMDRDLVRAERSRRLVGDASKARGHLGWAPTVSFDELVRLLVDGDLARLDSTRS
jgi:GDPmannose 4,6-dehydratase